MLSPFGFAPHSLRLGTSPNKLRGTSQAKLHEVSRSFNSRALLAMNEILRHYVPQNDLGSEPVISHEVTEE